jgi:hypothetical protein
VPIDVKPHAYDPATHPEFFEGVLARRLIAFFIDLIVIAIPIVFLAILIFAFGIVTLGFGWLLFWLLSPLSVIWAIVYFGLTLGIDRHAGDGDRDAHLVWRAGLLRAGRHPRHRILVQRIVLHAAHPAGVLLQSPAAALARYRARDDHRQ